MPLYGKNKKGYKMETYCETLRKAMYFLYNVSVKKIYKTHYFKEYIYYD